MPKVNNAVKPNTQMANNEDQAQISIKAKKIAVIATSISLIVMSIGLYLNVASKSGPVMIVSWAIALPIVLLAIFSQAQNLAMLVLSLKQNEVKSDGRDNPLK